MRRIDLILILGIGGLIAFILWKTGAFKIAKAGADLAEGASKVVSSAIDLPQNLVTLVSETPDVLRSLGTQTGLPFLPKFEVAEPTARAQTIVDSINRLYPGLSMQEQLARVHADGITFNAEGNPVDRNGALI